MGEAMFVVSVSFAIQNIESFSSNHCILPSRRPYHCCIFHFFGSIEVANYKIGNLSKMVLRHTLFIFSHLQPPVTIQTFTGSSKHCYSFNFCNINLIHSLVKYSDQPGYRAGDRDKDIVISLDNNLNFRRVGSQTKRFAYPPSSKFIGRGGADSQ